MDYETVQLRSAELSDLPQVLALHQAGYLCNADESLELTPEVMQGHVYGPTETGEPGFSERMRANYHEWLADESTHFVVAELDGTVAGYATVVDQGRQSLLDGLYVDPVHHRQGIGTMLLQHSERIATNSLYLWVVAHAPARSFYKKHGYAETSSEPQTIPIVGGYTMKLVEMRRP